MRKFVLFLMVIASMGMTGCAGTKLMQPIDHAQVNETVNSDEAVIVFFRPPMFRGRALNPGLIEVGEKEKLSFVAIMSNGTKYIHRTTPGKHQYFWSTTSILGPIVSYPLEANIEAGKIYYTGVFGDNPFTPVINVSDETFKKDFASCDWVQNTPDGQQWFDKNIKSLQDKYTQMRIAQGDETAKVKIVSYHKDGTKSESEIDMIIKPEYGTNTPVR